MKKLIRMFFGLLIVAAVLFAVAYKFGFVVHIPQQDYKVVMSRKVVDTIGQDAKNALGNAVGDHHQNGNDMDLIRTVQTQTARVNFVQAAVEGRLTTVCLHGVDVHGNVKEYRIPAACEAGHSVMFWTGDPKKTVRVELFSGDGEMLTVQPSLFTGWRSMARPLGGNRWEVEGFVSYLHDVSGKARILRITVE